jgi:hypothetical protein
MIAAMRSVNSSTVSTRSCCFIAKPYATNWPVLHDCNSLIFERERFLNLVLEVKVELNGSFEYQLGRRPNTHSILTAGAVQNLFGVMPSVSAPAHA